MRLQSEKKVSVRNRVFGGANPLICLPLVAKEKSEMLQQAEALRKLNPDVVEWRIDSYDHVEAVDDCLAVLASLRQCMADIPIILTCRIDSEGGFKSISADRRLALIQAAAATGHVDLVDVEMGNQAGFIEKVKAAASLQDVRLILSYHNFDRTPEEAFIVDKLLQAQKMGADIAKVAVMPRNYGDVLVLLNATFRARTEHLKIPMITMSMGSQGGVTRVAGGLFGSDLTFAVGKESSAPGQIPIGELRKAMTVLYNQPN